MNNNERIALSFGPAVEGGRHHIEGSGGGHAALDDSAELSYPSSGAVTDMQLSPQPQAKPLNVPQALAQALEFHRQGRLAEAERLYASILAVRPDHFDALQMMGVVKLARGQPAEALQLIAAAMRARKPSPQVLLNYGLALNALDRHTEALDTFDQAIKLKSRFAEAHNNRAAVLAAMGRDEEAIEAYRKAVAIAPAYAEAHYNLGNVLRTQGRHDDAVRSFDRALSLRPKYADAHNNRGTVLMTLGRVEEALASFERALAIEPGHANALGNRYSALSALNRFEEALAAPQHAAAGFSERAEDHYNSGKILTELNRYADAVASHRQALAIKPDYADAAFAVCTAELPILYSDEAEIDRQRAAYEQNLKALCQSVEAGRLGGDLIKAMSVNQPFLLAYQGRNDRDLRALYGALSCRIAAQGSPAAMLHAPTAPGEKIRVGVVSSFFYLHSNWKIPIKGWLGQIDRTRFEIVGYHIGSTRDAETEAAAAMCDKFVHRQLTADGWRREILSDAPHVLLYPGLCMDNISAQLAAQRLAPVQITSWGHPETSGMPTIDYFLSSDLMEPPDAADHYTERLVRLPNLSIYYEPENLAPAPMSRAELGMRPDASVFWCGQSVYKYLPQYDQAFPRIAKEYRDCQFAFIRHSGGEGVNELFQRRLEQAFAEHGLNAADHCLFLSRLGASQFVSAIGLCDVFLDSIGWSGCNSTLESLPHDLPIVTMTGPLMRGRHSAAILKMMGVTDTVAGTLDEYVAIAARLASDSAERQAVSERIAANKHRVYRDRACITALEDLLERSVRQGGAR
jgi:protein O-GlcNAc transferase